MNFLVAQLGARMHYAVPRIFHEADRLTALYTDLCAARGWPRVVASLPPSVLPGGLRRMAARRPRGVPRDRIRVFTDLGWRYVARLRRARCEDEKLAVYTWAGSEFARRVARHVPGEGGVYVFNQAGLEVLDAARARGVHSVLEQTIAPKAIEFELLTADRERFPDWEAGGPARRSDALARYIDREEAEWAAADRILCGSGFVLDGIRERGGPVEKCRVVPYGVDARFAIERGDRAPGPLRVLTVGVVGLRKGSPWVLETARRLGRRAKFRMVGPLDVPPGARERLAREVEVVGPVPRSEVRDHYAWADVFFLPSICEGSATVCFEALAAGLPVVCTPNTGSVVRDGVDGRVVPARDADAMAEAIATWADDPTRLAPFCANAVERARAYTVDRYAERLLRAVDGPDATEAGVVARGTEAASWS